MLNKRIGLSSCSALTAVPLIRSFSAVPATLGHTLAHTQPSQYKPESLALEHINSGSATTSSVINKILLNQNLSVSDAKLEELLKVKGVLLRLLKQALRAPSCGARSRRKII